MVGTISLALVLSLAHGDHSHLDSDRFQTYLALGCRLGDLQAGHQMGVEVGPAANAAAHHLHRELPGSQGEKKCNSGFWYILGMEVGPAAAASARHLPGMDHHSCS